MCRAIQDRGKLPKSRMLDPVAVPQGQSDRRRDWRGDPRREDQGVPRVGTVQWFETDMHQCKTGITPNLT